MDGEKSGAPRSSIWFAVAAICLIAVILELSVPSLPPMVAPLLLAAAIGLRLPAQQFPWMVVVLGVVMIAPAVVGVGDRQILHRTIGLICLGLMALTRYRSIPFLSRPDPLNADTTIPRQPAPAPATEIHATEHRGVREDDEFSLDDGLAHDYVAPAMKRLDSVGNFDEDQLRLIETEMRLLQGHNIAVNYASSLEKGVQVGRFVIDEALGRGGEGNVYRAHDADGQPAAIKLLHNMRVSDRFRREMHLVRRLAHPNIVTAYEVGEFRGLPFITMELLHGPDLHALIQSSGAMNWLESTTFVLQTARALAHAHQRDLIHRDIKPGNLILNGDGQVKVVDFGLAAMCGNDTTMDSVFRFETQEGHLAGTLPFMAPEQARSLANATVRSDIYALGATWFYLLTGHERLRGKTFAKQFENLLVRRRFATLPRDCMPQSLREIYRRMVAYDVKNRFDSCDQLVAELESCLKTEGESVQMEGINVLVVEDSRTDMMFTIEMLRRSNSTLTIYQARTLQDGLSVCGEKSIDLVLLDLTLPDSSGVETVVSFRESFPKLPLVVLTGLTQDEVGADCLAAGADTFISKNGLSAHRMERTIFVTLSRCRFPRKAVIQQ